MVRRNRRAQELWYRDARPSYELLSTTVETLLRQLITYENIEHLAVTSRTKSLSSFAGKIARKSYKDPSTEMTDLSGIRVITYIESDVTRVSDLIEQHFVVDVANSFDKATDLSVDRVGYRSVHYVCELNSERLALPEYATCAGLKFEVQVRTALQHAWAQIEHDRNYKFSGSLPDPIQRRLYLAAGMLEIADREFDAIAREVDEYSEFVAKKTAAGELDVDLNSASFASYMEERFGDRFRTIQNPETTAQLLGELRRFGIHTLQDLSNLLSEEFLRRSKTSLEPTSDVGIVRQAMFDRDFARYFEQAYAGDWTRMDDRSFRVLAEELGEQHLTSILNKHGVSFGEDQDESYLPDFDLDDEEDDA